MTEAEKIKAVIDKVIKVQPSAQASMAIIEALKAHIMIKALKPEVWLKVESMTEKFVKDLFGVEMAEKYAKEQEKPLFDPAQRN